MNKLLILLLTTAILTTLAACTGTTESITLSEPVPSPQQDTQESLVDPTATPGRELEIVTLLPRDAIPAIDDPTFLSAEEAAEQYAPDELVIGVEFEGDARAYSIPLLSSHEIVNDTVGGRKIAVTW